jgi:hypothetical protein
MKILETIEYTFDVFNKELLVWCFLNMKLLAGSGRPRWFACEKRMGSRWNNYRGHFWKYRMGLALAAIVKGTVWQNKAI